MSKWRKLLSCVVIVSFVMAIVLWGVNWGQRLELAKRDHCISNLSFIRVGKVVCDEELSLREGDPVPLEALEKAITNAGTSLAKLKCPKGGVYVIGPSGTNPRCSYTNFSYTWELQGDPPWLKRKAWRHFIGP